MDPAVGNHQRDLIGYGQNEPTVRWPGDARVAVNLVVNYEEGSEYSFALGDGVNEKHGGEEEYPFPEGKRDLAQESVFEYGSRVGIWRLMRLFEEYDLPVTFSACALAFELNPAVAQAARAAGHDLLAHGYRWEEVFRLNREAEREQLHKAVASFEKTWGERPPGWYCRYGPSIHTRELVVEEGGFVYDGDAYNDDYPYFVKVGDHDQLVVPYSLTYNDLQGSRTPGDILEYARRALDELWLEGERGHPKMMSVGLHPRMIGQAARTNALREFIEHASDKGGVWFARKLDIANWWLENHEDFVS